MITEGKGVTFCYPSALAIHLRFIIVIIIMGYKSAPDLMSSARNAQKWAKN